MSGKYIYTDPGNLTEIVLRIFLVDKPEEQW